MYFDTHQPSTSSSDYQASGEYRMRVSCENYCGIYSSFFTPPYRFWEPSSTLITGKLTLEISDLRNDNLGATSTSRSLCQPSLISTGTSLRVIPIQHIRTIQRFPQPPDLAIGLSRSYKQENWTLYNIVQQTGSQRSVQERHYSGPGVQNCGVMERHYWQCQWGRPARTYPYEEITSAA